MTIKKNLSYYLNLSRWKRLFKYSVTDFSYGSRYLAWKMKDNGNSSKGRFGSQNSDYDGLSKIFSNLSIEADDVIVDVGCGRGRLFNYLLSQGYKNRQIGIEVDKEVAEFTKRRLSKYSQVEIVVADVEEENSLPNEATIFYLFNPFCDQILKSFSDQVENKIKRGELGKKDRPLIIYYNSKARLHIFESNPFWKVKRLGVMSHTQMEAAIIAPSHR